MRYVGLDAHLRQSTFCVLDARGRKIYPLCAPEVDLGHL